MGSLSSVIAWLAIGMGVAIVGGILPFYRGARGFVLNATLSVAGAILGGLFGRLLHAYTHVSQPFGFLCAAVGAFCALWGGHMFWSANEQRHHREV